VDFDFGRSPQLMSQRVRAMFPWSATAPAEPVGALIRTHRAIHSGAEVTAIRKAYFVAEKMHRGQMRKSGEPYITHPLAVARILAELGMDTTTLVAALLHDTVEDTSYTMPQLREDFGREVALLVDGVTKFDKVFYGASAEAETIRKMLITAGQDVRVLVVKIADRLHNMRTLDARSTSSRARIARATQEVLVPLCDRLGIQALKRELEDTVLWALEPETHAKYVAYVSHRPQWMAYLQSFVSQAETTIKSAKIPARVMARPRHLFSIWKDTAAGGYAEPHDLPRIVVLVDGPETECYTALGEVHGRWRPVPGRFKDFIASPKNNLYRSLHTTVVGPNHQQVEVLIRTETMHRNAEYGIAASFRFPVKESSTAKPTRKIRTDATRAEHLAWLHRVVEWQADAVDPAQFLDSLRCDLTEAQIHVFAGQRRLLLPAGATPVDVAYALGEDFGSRCVAASVNGQLAPLSSLLDDGDRVEIHTAAPGQLAPDGSPIGPSREWLSFVRTPDAQLQITRYLDEQEADEATDGPLPIGTRIRLGRAAVALALHHRQRGLADDKPLVKVAAQLGLPDVDALFIAVSDKTVDADDVVTRLIETVDVFTGTSS
jgi:GTP diphosphokinase / guanosine-3',5'-bis(diphosphate) 3'-diphosphatase